MIFDILCRLKGKNAPSSPADPILQQTRQRRDAYNIIEGKTTLVNCTAILISKYMAIIVRFVSLSFFFFFLLFWVCFYKM